MLASNDDLFSGGLIADDFVWPGNIEPDKKITACVKIRLASKPVECTVERYEPEEGENFVGNPWKIMFAEPQRAVAPGQSAVLYSDGVCIGGGIISRTL